jgi:flagellar motor component MotA
VRQLRHRGGAVRAQNQLRRFHLDLEAQAAASGRFLRCIKNGLVAFARGAPPLVAVEVARHVVFSDDRPEAEQLAEACRSAATRAVAA